ncbi:hypothetical protein TSUD_54820 [Trifolium subterraneum]|uniref:Uncharacterized protein n=1 Tax=Trifolium subterraneum TaxID=3900 RepID=A0A2Z6MXI6_TRISU|nr:hypothetical protein TSUD_54820 [Trifolium subterraneum]
MRNGQGKAPEIINLEGSTSKGSEQAAIEETNKGDAGNIDTVGVNGSLPTAANIERVGVNVVSPTATNNFFEDINLTNSDQSATDEEFVDETQNHGPT